MKKMFVVGASILQLPAIEKAKEYSERYNALFFGNYDAFLKDSSINKSDVSSIE